MHEPAQQQISKDTTSETFEEILPSGLTFRMIYVPGGMFRMGSENNDVDALDREKPINNIKLKSFYLGEVVVTQDLWVSLLSKNPSGLKGSKRPVEHVSWENIEQNFMPELRKVTGKQYRLPTEAEWEYAARGGPYWETENYRFAGSDLLKQVGWYDKNSKDATHDVGLLLPNALRIYDMSGNVWEWCTDWFSETYYAELNFQKSVIENPIGPPKGFAHVLRGGSCFNNENSSRITSRSYNKPASKYTFIGFRLALSNDQKY